MSGRGAPMRGVRGDPSDVGVRDRIKRVVVPESDYSDEEGGCKTARDREGGVRVGDERRERVGLRRSGKILSESAESTSTSHRSVASPPPRTLLAALELNHVRLSPAHKHTHSSSDLEPVSGAVSSEMPPSPGAALASHFPGTCRARLAANAQPAHGPSTHSELMMREDPPLTPSDGGCHAELLPTPGVGVESAFMARDEGGSQSLRPAGESTPAQPRHALGAPGLEPPHAFTRTAGGAHCTSTSRLEPSLACARTAGEAPCTSGQTQKEGLPVSMELQHPIGRHPDRTPTGEGI